MLFRALLYVRHTSVTSFGKKASVFLGGGTLSSLKSPGTLHFKDGKSPVSAYHMEPLTRFQEWLCGFVWAVKGQESELKVYFLIVKKKNKRKKKQEQKSLSNPWFLV